MKKSSMIFSCLFLLLLGAAGLATADPVLTVYDYNTNHNAETDWRSAVGSGVRTEDFSDLIFSGVTPTTTLPSANAGRINQPGYVNQWYEVMLRNYVTTWSFSPAITAFGATWNPNAVGPGPGLTLTLVFEDRALPDQLLSQEISATFDGKFFGFTSPVHVSQVKVTVGTQSSSNKETYVMDNMVYVPVPATRVELLSFSAKGSREGVELEWKTASEIDNAGFNLWRSQKKNGRYINITEDALIPAKGDATTSASYSYTDTDVVLGGKYFYRLQDIDTTGASTFNGPVSAAAGEIILLFPEENEQLDGSSAAEFKWDGTGFNLFQLQFCNRSDFKRGVIVLPMGGGVRDNLHGSRWISDSSYTPGSKEWNKIKQLGRNGKIVYWRVTGTNESRNVLNSKVSGFQIQ